MEATYLTEESIREFIARALAEDVGDGDHSSLASIPADARNQAKLLVKGEGVLAGVELASYVFHAVDPGLQLEVMLQDGTQVKHGDVAFHVSGKARSILTAERLVLNCMQRMSGIATYTRHLAQLIEGTGAKLLDTRKTTPNFRMMEKWAVRIGGGHNHRFGLFDMVMLKDNHVDYAGGIRAAITATQHYLQEKGKDLRIVVETRNLEEVKEALATGGMHRIMLDNMAPATMREAVKLIAGKYETEASGGITEETIRAVAECGVDYISVGALTHSIKSMDLSLKAFK
ncbi:nicotinate-nucleotide pyrophosphorylase [carboxylating] [Pontibacter ummariensis]|uniref:Probable nicotinate-nucleotide pyrophosphorylase [carboxylating] n=1 Tax=Pontibacter ummariensis TaxID=1610492 RepID=A0A239CMA2_9BACT|nr:carboxylating nicotinate-nucleotide diphosphorylase [Pontibacter ummariensis]PRY14933.1 nicotinate-nucleotide pyrophosphorylase [carboxylating] [Pontibacter ummariensis]SNS21285.1 nicotinate-nucleotide pyrophosphorylase [carboxylating] [Pontibacter ummariensis]